MSVNKPNSPIDKYDGGGPWTLLPHEQLNGDIQPGEVASYALREYEYRGRKGYFVPWLPLDVVQITNLSGSNPVTVEINGQFRVDVPPNATRTYSDTGITMLTVENVGDTAISAGNLKLELAAERYDADAQAYDEKTTPAAKKVLKGLIGL